VIAGRAQANVGGNTVIAWAAKQNPQVKATYLHSTGLVWSIAVRKDNAEMRAQLENAIECLKQEGTLAKLHEQWFGVPPAPGSTPVTIQPGTGVPDMPGYDPTPRTPQCS
jgi:polar amino acid transport system substrate-binding protein